MSDGAEGVLLDTCAAIWLMNGTLKQRVFDEILALGAPGKIYVSPISAWEIGMLSRPRLSRPAILEFAPDPRIWFSNLMRGPGIRPAALTPDIAIEASYLPGTIHNDPADRLLVATARIMRLAIATGDEKIIDYAAAGHVQVIAC
jgi:PIN domain nuclease of toxin-antitoxin system